MKTIKYNDYIFFKKKTVGSTKKVVKMFGVKYHSYAGDTVKRVVNYYFGINLKRDYKLFYQREFSQYKDFLECKMGIPSNVVEKIVQENVFFVDLSGKGDQIGRDFFMEDRYIDLFWKIVGGLEDESTDWIRDEQFFY